MQGTAVISFSLVFAIAIAIPVLVAGEIQSTRANANMPRLVKNAEEAGKFVDDLVSKHKVVVFSKTTCPYCVKAKNLLKELNASAHTIELDKLDSADATLIQEALKKKTKQSTVPNIFINGKHVGGCDDTVKLHSQGKLVPLLTAA
jgi:glutaredoxin 3